MRLPHKLVQFVLEGTKVSVTCGASRFTLATMPVDQYPALPELPQRTGIIDGAAAAAGCFPGDLGGVAGRDLADSHGRPHGDRGLARSRCSPPTATGSRCASSSGSRRSPMSRRLRSCGPRPLATRPRRSGPAMLTCRLVEGTGVDLIGFSAGGLVTTSLLMDGDYPPVRRLFPDENPITAVVRTQDLIEATRRVALVAERNSSVRLAFGEGEVVLDAGQTDDAQASEALEATLDGEAITVAFNPSLSARRPQRPRVDYVQFGFLQETKPVEFVGIDKPGGTVAAEFRYLLVPIRITSWQARVLMHAVLNARRSPAARGLPLLRGAGFCAGRGRHDLCWPQRPRQDQPGRGRPVPVHALVSPRRDRRSAHQGRRRAGDRGRQGGQGRAIAHARGHHPAGKGKIGATRPRCRAASRPRWHSADRRLRARGPVARQGRPVRPARVHGRAMCGARAGTRRSDQRLRAGVAAADVAAQDRAQRPRGPEHARHLG